MNGNATLETSKRRMNERMDGQTDRRRESNLVHLALNVTSGDNSFNEFHDNQLIKFRVFIDRSRDFSSTPLKFL